MTGKQDGDNNSQGGASKTVVECKEMFETDVLQNIDHCEIVAGGTNHHVRLSEGFGTFGGGRL